MPPKGFRSLTQTQTMNIEPLEARIAPASVLAYADIDGDKVTITSSIGNLANHATIVGGQLQLLDLSDPSFNHANITVSVVKAGAGDGLAAVGRINAGANDLGVVSIKGDLGDIDAGSNTGGTPAIKSLSVRSMGVYGLATQGGAGDLESDIHGALGSLNVAGDVKEAFINVTGASATIGPVSIGGSLIGGANTSSGQIYSDGGIGAVKIGHDVQGGTGVRSGFIDAGGGGAAIGPVTIGGSLIGGSSDFCGSIFSGLGIGAVKIGQDVQGGSGQDSGKIDAAGGLLASLTIGGSVIGSGGTYGAYGHLAQIGGDGIGAVSIGGSLIGGFNTYSGEILSAGGLGAVKIGHDVRGGSAANTGHIESNGKTTGITLGGSLIGGSNTSSGAIFSAGGLGAVKIGHDVQGGSGVDSGYIDSIGDLAGVTLGGSLIGGSTLVSGSIFSNSDMGAVKIGGDLKGGSGSSSGLIDSSGKLASVTLGGSLVGGSNTDSGEIFSGGDMGAVKIGGDIKGASIASGSLESSGLIESFGGRIASVTLGGSIFAGVDNSSGGSLTGNASIHAAHDLGSLTVKGGLIGSVGSGGDITNVIISAKGQAFPTATADVAIGKITIGGRVERAQILAGYNTSLTATDGNAQIGTVSVGGDWAASDLVAGVQDGGSTGFGDAGDFIIGGGASIAKIAAITIEGVVIGTPAAGDRFGFESHAIGSFKAAGVSIPIVTPVLLSLITGSDVTIRKV